MADLKKILDDLDFLSDRISSQIRTVAVSLLIVIWGLILAKPEEIPGVSEVVRTQLIKIGALSLLAMFLDYLQYFFGYHYTNSIRKKAESEKSKTASYRYTDWRYRARTWFFHLKQLVLGVAVVWFFIVVLRIVM